MSAFPLPPDSAKHRAFWLALNDAALDACARLHPEEAIDNAASLLTDERFAWCAARAPVHALHVAPERVPAELLAECVRHYPAEVAEHAARRLSPAQIGEIADRYPPAALQHLAGRLTSVELAGCVKRAPREALECALERLSPDQQLALVARCWANPAWRDKVVMHAGGALCDEQINEFLTADDWATRCHRYAVAVSGCPDRLSQAQLDVALSEHPALTLLAAMGHLTPEQCSRAATYTDAEDIERTAAGLQGRLDPDALVARRDACLRLLGHAVPSERAVPPPKATARTGAGMFL